MPHEWELPGAHEQAPGVWRIPLPLPGDGLRAVNVYAIADGERLVMIDGGWSMQGSAELLAQALCPIGFEPADIREFLVTHVHRDHYTLAVALRREHGSSVSLGEGERVTLEAIGTLSAAHEATQLRAAGAFRLAEKLALWSGPPETPDFELPDRWLADGIELPLQSRTLRVIATPGHTRGHVVFHDPDARVLFAGDHVLPHITPSIGFEFPRPPSPLRDYLASLRLVRALPEARLLPAHGPAAPSVHLRVDELLAHHEKRLAAMLGAVLAGADTAFEVARAVGWTRRETPFDELNTFNQFMAVQETQAHLTVLVEAGELTESAQDGVVHYSAR